MSLVMFSWALWKLEMKVSTFEFFYPLTGCENTAIYGGDEHQSKLF
jgi:hypothetical protein